MIPKVGDVVQLPSGGPEMTVTNVLRASDTLEVTWFNDRGDVCEGSLPARAVRHIPSP